VTTTFASSDPKKKLYLPSTVNSSQTARKSSGMFLISDRFARFTKLTEKPFPVGTAGGARCRIDYRERVGVHVGLAAIVSVGAHHHVPRADAAVPFAPTT